MDVEGEVKEEVKIPKVPKASRYYYRHREDILARRRERLMADPEYVAKQNAREEAKEAKEAAKRAREEAKEEKRKRMAALLGAETPRSSA